MNARLSYLLRLCGVALLAALTASMAPAGHGGVIINPYRFAAASSYDADAQDFFTRVVTNGGTISDTTKAAVNTFVLAAKTNSYWTKLNRINLFCGDQLAACLTPLKVGGGSATETNVNFVSGDYSETTGLKGNGSNKYLNTGLSPSVSLSLDSTHYAVYNRSLQSASTGYSGSDNTVSQRFICSTASSNYRSDQYAASGNVTAAATAGNVGHIVFTRLSSTDLKIYRNGSQIGTTATLSSGTLPTVPFYLFGLNRNNSSVDSWQSEYLAGYSIGAGLSPVEAAALNVDMEAFQDALSRGVN